MNFSKIQVIRSISNSPPLLTGGRISDVVVQQYRFLQMVGVNFRVTL
jgi:hypothetical protein